MARPPQTKEENALTTQVQPPRLPYPAQALEFDIKPAQWLALVDAVFPSAKTVSGVMLALSYAKARGLDVFKRTIHVVPMYNSALGREVETVWPGIGEIRTTAQRTGQCAGIDDCQFGPEITAAFKDVKQGEKRNGDKYTKERSCLPISYPSWAQVTVYRMVQGQRCAFVGPKVRFVETYSGMEGMKVPNARWQRAPYQMLEKCAEAAAWRRAFPEECGDMHSVDEMEGKVFDQVIEGEFSELDVPTGQENQENGKPDAEAIKREAAERASQFQSWLERLKNRLNGYTDMTSILDERAKYEEKVRDSVDPKDLEIVDRLFDAARIRIEDTQNQEFVKTFKADCQARRGNMIDLNSLWADMKDTIEGLPDDLAAECEEAFESSKPNTEPGTAAAGEGDLLRQQGERNEQGTTD